jgi:acetoin utilization protein AcuB
MKQMPKIEKVMTPMPYTVDGSASIKYALQLMREHRIRHLPVLNLGEVVGIITDRDIKLASGFQGSEKIVVEDVMTPHPYIVKPQAPLDAVASEMAEHKYGCAIVRQENGAMVGIFTAVDALRCLSDTMREHYRPMQ